MYMYIYIYMLQMLLWMLLSLYSKKVEIFKADKISPNCSVLLFTFKNNLYI